MGVWSCYDANERPAGEGDALNEALFAALFIGAIIFVAAVLPALANWLMRDPFDPNESD